MSGVDMGGVNEARVVEYMKRPLGPVLTLTSGPSERLP
jgi:hypothetical protein